MKEKILITTSTFPRWEGDAQPRFILDFAISLTQYFDVYVLAPGYKGASRREEYNNITVFRFDYFFSGLQLLAYGEGMADNIKRQKILYLILPFFLLFQLVSALRLIVKYKIKLLNTHWIYPQGIVGLVLKVWFRKKLFWVNHSHGGDLYRFPGLNFIKKWVVERSDLNCVVSRAMRRYVYEDLKAKREAPVVVNSMGVDFKTTFKDYTPFEDRNGIIFVGRLSPKKGVDILIKAVAELKERGVSIDLLIVGAGETGRYRELCSQKMIANQVRFFGGATHLEVCKLLNEARFFVFSSHTAESGDQEGLGLAPIEAMGSGCLVVASNIPQVEDYINHGETGVLFSPSDSQSLANELEKLVRSPADAKKIAARGREYAIFKYDWAVVSRAFVEEINQRLFQDNSGTC